MDMSLTHTAIVHFWSNGEIEYVNVLDNSALTTKELDGEHAPEWLQERTALLRLCDVNKANQGELIGRKFTDHMVYVYLTYDEYRELINIINQTGVKS